MSLAGVKDYVAKVFEGKIDFEGQKQVEQILRVSLIAATIISFILGFALQSIQVTFVTFGISTLLLSLVIVPPWPMYNRHPVVFLAAKPEVQEDTKKSE